MTYLASTAGSPLVARAIFAASLISFAYTGEAAVPVPATGLGPIMDYRLITRFRAFRATNTAAPAVDGWMPRTELGRKLAKHRAALIASGAKLKSLDEINAELAESRRS